MGTIRTAAWATLSFILSDWFPRIGKELERTLRLGINGWRLTSRRTGVARYLRHLVRAWTNQSTTRFSAMTVYTPRPLDADDEVAVSPAIQRRVLTPDARMLVWENAVFGPRVDDDVLFCPSYSRPLRARGRTVVTTHDMIFCVRPELFPARSRAFYRTLYNWSVRHAALVVTPAEAVKAEIVHYCAIAPDRVRVTYLAPAPHFGVIDDQAVLAAVRRRVLGADVPFFLFVGKTTGRRSLPTVLEGFARLAATTALPHRLLFVGHGTDSPDLRSVVTRLGLGGRVVQSGFLDDETVNLLYNAAAGLVTGALYETTSLPVMEAQATGLPVICYRNAGMLEITGGAAMLLDTLTPHALCDAMVAIAEDTTLSRQLREGGLVSAARFSWDRCARDTMAVLEEAATA